MNREKMMAVRTRIAEVGEEHCDMNTWVNGTVRGEGEPFCGTAACLAGYTHAVEYGMFASYSTACSGAVRQEAETILGLPAGSGWKLFYTDEWPIKYRQIRMDEGEQKAMLAILDDMLDGTLEIAQNV